MRYLRGDWLVTFVAVVEARGFTAAAERLHRTQSAVSMQIQQLETAADAVLLVRERTGVVPTEAGERLLPHARRMVEALHDASTLFDTEMAPAGPLRLGIPEEYSGMELSSVLGRFQRSQPAAELWVRCASSEHLEYALEAGELDLAVLVADDARRRGEMLLYDPTWWVTAESLAIPSSGPLPLVLFDQACWWRQWALDRVAEAGREWRVAYTSDSIAGVAAAIRGGLGVGVLGRSTVPEGVRPVPDTLGLPALPGSHLMLRLAVPDAPGAMVMRRHLLQYFTARGEPGAVSMIR